MKKALTILVIFIVFIILYFIQANFFSWFTIAGIKPNLFIILALFLGLFIGEVYGVILGSIMGIILDFFIGSIIRNKRNNAWTCRIYGGQAEQELFKRQQNYNNAYSNGNNFHMRTCIIYT